MGLDEVGHAAGDGGFEKEHLAGAGGAEDLDVSHGGEFQVAQWRDSGVALGNDAGELGGGFGEQDAGEDGLAGEMAAQEGLIAADEVFARAAFAGVKAGQAVEEAKLGAVREAGEGEA